MTSKLNIPNPANSPENKFELVSFVNDMSHYSLKVLVKRLWENLHTLANTVESDRADISQAIDQILSGEKWDVNQLRSRYNYFYRNGEIIQYDSHTNEFTVMKCYEDGWGKNNPVKGMSCEEINKAINRGEII